MTGRGRHGTVGGSADQGVRDPKGALVIARHPYRAVGAVFAVFSGSYLLGGLIGQHHEGPWGGLPAWLNTANYVVFAVSVLVLIALSIYLGVAHLRCRKAVG